MKSDVETHLQMECRSSVPGTLVVVGDVFPLATFKISLSERKAVRWSCVQAVQALTPCLLRVGRVLSASCHARPRSPRHARPRSPRRRVSPQPPPTCVPAAPATRVPAAPADGRSVTLSLGHRDSE